ncbi:MAG: Nudix family hydrolase [Pseudomonadota bacterium]
MTRTAVQRIVHVAVGVIVDDAGRVLIALRPEGVHQGGLWEFPGGKCEPGEPVEDALRRELHEELGITVLRQQPLCVIRHHYGDKEVLLDVHRVDQFVGVPVGREGQPIRWVEMSALEPTQFPAANRPIIQRLQLPRLVAITGTARTEADFFARFTRLLEQSPSLVQLRAPELHEARFVERAQRCSVLCRQHGVRLQFNAHPAVVADLDVDGVHVNARTLMALHERPVPQEQLFSASCHDLAELQQAEALGADFVFLSPVAATPSHPAQAGLGWEAFRILTSAVGVPVYALGGLGAADVEVALAHGAAGIAGISAFWPAECE